MIDGFVIFIIITSPSLPSTLLPFMNSVLCTLPCSLFPEKPSLVPASAFAFLAAQGVFPPRSCIAHVNKISTLRAFRHRSLSCPPSLQQQPNIASYTLSLLYFFFIFPTDFVSCIFLSNRRVMSLTSHQNESPLRGNILILLFRV